MNTATLDTKLDVDDHMARHIDYHKKKARAIRLSDADWTELERLARINNMNRSALISTLLQVESNIAC